VAEQIDDLLGLEFTIDSLGDTPMSNGENAFIIYLKIDNKTLKSRKISLLKATYVTIQREQLEQDIWLPGYITGDDNLRPNSFKKAGLVFYKSKLKTISDSDVIYISIELVQEGVELNLSFQKTGNNWVLTSNEKKEIKIELEPEQLIKKLHSCIERLEVFEERIGLSIQNISIKIENYDKSFTLLCEVIPINGTTIKEPLRIECVLYNNAGLIIGKNERNFVPENFFGFKVIEMPLCKKEIAQQVNKIRLYPVKQ